MYVFGECAYEWNFEFDYVRDSRRGMAAQAGLVNTAQSVPLGSGVTLAAATAAEYAVRLLPEYTSSPTVYAGVTNYLTLNVENTSEKAGANVSVSALSSLYGVSK